MTRRKSSYYCLKFAMVALKQKPLLQAIGRNMKCYSTENIQYYLIFTQLRNGLESRSLLQNYNGIISLPPTLFMMVNRLRY